MESLTEAEAEELLWDWRFWARPSQLAPDGDWANWILRAGRGFGKTRSGAGWFQERMVGYPGRWGALVAKTPADARDYMIEGPGGLLKNAREDQRAVYEPSKRRLVWPNGSWATIYSDAEPDQVRGFSGDTAWLDEFAKYRNPQLVWDNLSFGMREASTDRPRKLITTTPRPLAVLKAIEKMASTVVRTGSSYENKSNLDPSWFTETIAVYEGSRFGRQEIHAEILEDVPGALWNRRILDEYRVSEAPPLKRIVVAVDPNASNTESSKETGIVVAGVCGNNHGYVLDDLSLKGSPEEWARRAVAGLNRHDADRIVAEKNQGGDMVAATIRAVNPNVPVTLVHASRGKYTRAEPISALYDQGRIHHVGCLATLEDQMVAFTPEMAADDEAFKDRTDALVWSLTDLFPMMTQKTKKELNLESPQLPVRRHLSLNNPARGNSWMGR